MLPTTCFQKKVIFFLFEVFLFFLPTIPSNPYVRYTIALLYFISHRYRVQYYYASTKKGIIENKLEHKLEHELEDELEQV